MPPPLTLETLRSRLVNATSMLQTSLSQKNRTRLRAQTYRNRKRIEKIESLKKNANSLKMRPTSILKTVKIKRSAFSRSVLNSIPLLMLANNILKPYEIQNNTGNIYEIYEILTVLRKMGLSNEDVASLEPSFNKIMEKTKTQSQAKMKEMIDLIKRHPTGTGLIIRGKKVVSLRNATQDDEDSYTADIIYIFEDGSQLGESITGGNIHRDGTIKKCISNPTCTRYGCSVEDVKIFKDIEKKAVIEYKKEMSEKYGIDESAWPQRIVTKASSDALTKVASEVIKRYNTLSSDRKVEIMEDILYLKEGNKPADILCVVNVDFKNIHRYHIISTKVGNDWTPSLRQRSVFIEMYINDLKIAETQVKFNDGVYRKGKTSSLTSSWNAIAFIDKLFNLEEFNF